jgi:ubiquinone/menaquinone biosynthesis C-methylase UbiE
MTTQTPGAATPAAGGPPSSEQIRTAWNRIATGFDDYVTPITIRHGAEALRRVEVGPGTRFLDVAAGTGALSIPAARRGAQVTAIDFAPAMVERLTARAAAEGLTDVTGQVMDCQALTFADDSFEVVASQNGVTMAPVAPGLAEMVRVTRPGGTVLVIAFGQLGKAEFLRFFLGAIRAAVPDFAVPPFDPPPPPFQLADPEVFRRVFSEAGLSGVTVEIVDWEMPFGSGTELWNEILNSNPIGGQLIAGLDEPRRTEVRRVLDGMISERAGDRTEAILHAEVLIGVGTKPNASAG